MPHIAFNDIKALKAAALFADKKDIRPPLQGVWVDCLGPHPVLYGTNGHMLGCVRIEAESDTPFAVMLPPDVVEAVCKTQADALELRSPDSKNWTLQGEGTSWTWTAETSPYNWRERAVPSSVNLQPCNVNYHLLVPFIKAAVLLAGKYFSPVVSWNSELRRASYVTIPAVERFFGILTQAVDEGYDAPATPPSWLGISQSTAAIRKAANG